MWVRQQQGLLLHRQRQSLGWISARGLVALFGKRKEEKQTNEEERKDQKKSRGWMVHKINL